MGDQHPELGAPIPHVVQPQDRMAAELQNTGQGVANDRGAQVPHVHLLGDVRAGEVHHHRRGLLHGRNAEASIPKALLHLRRQTLGLERDVDETGARNLRLQAEGHEGLIGLELLHHRLGDLAGGLAQGLGQGQGAIGLEIPEFRLTGRGELGIKGLPGRRGLRESPLHRIPQLVLQGVGDAEHGDAGEIFRSSLSAGMAQPEKRMLRSSQLLRVTGALVEIRSIPVAP